jgi:transposase
VIDSQSVKGAETVGVARRGYDAGKKINGVKRHVAVDTLGLRERFSTIQLVWADGGYAGRLVTWAAKVIRLTVTIVKRSDDAKGFAVVPRRWVVERTLAWLTGNRRLVRDYERRADTHEAVTTIAMIALMSRRLARAA